MAFTKITNSDYADKGIRIKNNPLGLSVSDAQRAFDELTLDVIIPKFNELSNELDADKAGNEAEVEKLKKDKVDKIEGKGLSTNDYTNDEKNTVADVKNKADKSNVIEKNSTTDFTPTADTHPANKKYVDNAIEERVKQIGSGDMAQAIYDPQRKKTDIFAEMEKYLPLTGGTLTGNLFLKDLDNTSTETARIFEYAKSLYLETSHSNGYSRIQIDNPIKSDLANSLAYGYVKEGASFSGKIFGQHNKPGGRYSGSGDATAREISIGGIQGFGSYGLLWITSSYGDVLVGSYGALIWKGATVTAIGKPAAWYYNGILYLATTDNAFNISGQNYTYYVL